MNGFESELSELDGKVLPSIFKVQDNRVHYCEIIQYAGLLDVAEETVTDSAPPGAREKLLLADSNVYIGGVPKTIDTSR
jgi:hypothetical protein